MREGDIPRAVSLYKIAFEERPDPRLLYRLAQLHHRQGPFSEALNVYKAFLDKPGQDEEQRRKARESVAQLEKVVPRPPPPVALSPRPKVKAAPGNPLLIPGGILLGLGLVQGVAAGVLFRIAGDAGPADALLVGGHGIVTLGAGIPMIVIGAERNAAEDRAATR